MSINYPADFDTDAQIPRIDDNISEIGGDVINAIRELLFAMEKELGLELSGSAADLAARLGVSIDDAGNIKASALAAAGLVSLPIYNGQIASTAGIEESKLDLDYGTAFLKTALDSLTVLVRSIESALSADIGNMAQHVAHPGAYGRHEAEDVDIGSGIYSGQTVQETVDDMASRIDAHIGDAVDAHDASAISVDTSNFQTIQQENVQGALEVLETLDLAELTRHRDRQHGNGILLSDDVFVPDASHGPVLVGPASISSVSAGDSSISFQSAPPAANFNRIGRNDRVDITVNGQTFTFTVESTSSVNVVNFFEKMPASAITGTAVVYSNAEETTAPSNLKAAIRKADISSRPATIQLVHPGAPYIMTSGFQGSRLSASAKNVRFCANGTDTGELDLFAKMQAFSADKSSWTAENVAKVLNEEVFAPGGNTTHLPLIAFEHNSEFGVALDEPLEDGYVEIGDVATGSAYDILGLVSGDRNETSANRLLYIDGYQMSGGVRKVLDAYGYILTTDTIKVPGANLSALGLSRGSLIRVDGPGIRTGTYVVEGVSADLLEFDPVEELDFGAGNLGKGLTVRVYSDSFSVDVAPAAGRTFYEMFVDGYADLPSVELRSSERATYEDTPGGGSPLGSVFDLVAVSRGFENSSKRLFYNSANSTVLIGDPAAGPSISDPGDAVSLPTPAANNPGRKIRIFDDYGAEYLEFEIAAQLPAADGYMDIEVYNRISEERFVQVGTVLHNKSEFKRLDDTRLFGTLGRNDVRSDYTRDYITYPRALLRGNGVIYGLKVTKLSSSKIQVSGGQALVDGEIVLIPKRVLGIPSDASSITLNVFVDRNGALRMLPNDVQTTTSVTPSTEELVTSSTNTILATVSTDGLAGVSSIEDYRRFVGKIDDRVDLIWEENDITHGSFASLSAAVRWIDAHDAEGLPVPRTIRVRGLVTVDLATEAPITLPKKVTLEGSTMAGPSTTSDPRILLQNQAPQHKGFIIPQAGCVLKNLCIQMDAVGAGADCLIGTNADFITDGPDIDNLTIENCSFVDVSGTGSDVFLIYGGGIGNLVISNCTATFNSDSAYFMYVLSTIYSKVDKVTVTGSKSVSFLTSNGVVSNVAIKNVDLYGTTLGNGGWILGASTISNVKIESCSSQIGGGGNSAFVYTNSTIENLAMSDCRFDVLGSSAAEYGVICGNFTLSDITNLHMTNCELGNVKYGVYADNIDRLWTSGCKLATTSSSAVFVDASGNITNSVILGSRFTGSGSIAAIRSAGEATNVHIDQCLMEGFDKSIHIISGASMLWITNCVFDNTATSGVIFGNSTSNPQDIYVCKNIFSKSGATASGHSFIKITGGERVYLTDNSMICTSTSSENGEMILIDETSSILHIENNTFVNTASDDQGFENVISLNGGGGAALGDHVDTYMAKNIIKNFFNTALTSKGISAINCNNIQIVENIVSPASQPIYMYNCQVVNISKNVLENGTDAGAKEVVLITGNSPAMSASFRGNFLTMTENLFKYMGDPSLVMQSASVKVENLATAFVGGAGQSGAGNISNNIFFAIAAGSQSGQSLLSTDSTADNFSVVGNIVWTDRGTGNDGDLVAYTSGSVFDIDGDNCFVIMNNLEHVSLSGSSVAVSVASLKSTNILNKGHQYAVHFGAHQMIASYDNFGNATWYRLWADDTILKSYMAASDSTYITMGPPDMYSDVVCAFGNDSVPPGALLERIELSFQISPGTVNNLLIGWFMKQTSGLGWDTIYAFANPSSTGGLVGPVVPESIVPASPTYMLPGSSCYFVLRAVDSGTWTTVIAKVVVYYTL